MLPCSLAFISTLSSNIQIQASDIQSLHSFTAATMHFSAITTVLFALGAMASPIANNETGTDANLVRRSNSCTRTSENAGADFHWNIYLDNDTYYNKKCGNGCLDNFRKQCGVISYWGCSLDGSRAHMTFDSTDFCTSYKISQALKSCTKGEQIINCV